MEFGVPRERSGGEIPERRVPLTPQGVRELVASGHRVYVEPVSYTHLRAHET